MGLVWIPVLLAVSLPVINTVFLIDFSYFWKTRIYYQWTKSVFGSKMWWSKYPMIFFFFLVNYFAILEIGLLPCDVFLQPACKGSFIFVRLELRMGVGRSRYRIMLIAQSNRSPFPKGGNEFPIRDYTDLGYWCTPNVKSGVWHRPHPSTCFSSR